ncbi:MAG: integrase core domain-containing protein [Acidobacteriaceae bacterium]
MFAEESGRGPLSRPACLDTHWLTDLEEAEQVVEAWRQEYNEGRPHRSLGERTRSEFASELAVGRDPAIA